MITQGSVTDCTKAGALLARFTAEHLLADRAYATHGVIAQCNVQKMQVVIPPKQSRKAVCCYAKAASQLRHLIENTLLPRFLIRCIALWARFYDDTI